VLDTQAQVQNTRDIREKRIWVNIKYNGSIG
jgi:hypothetical protein